jgi:hypothetical protein
VCSVAFSRDGKILASSGYDRTIRMWDVATGKEGAPLRGHSLAVLAVAFSRDGRALASVERAASEVVLLDAMQAFFEYEVHTCCGIPAITLEGTAEDWRALAARVEGFGRFGLEWWVEPLRPILGQFVAAAGGEIDRGFWESIYKYRGPKGSGSPHVSGWALALFPYLVNPEAKYARFGKGGAAPPPLHRNPWLGTPPGRHGPGRDDFPALPARAPFGWRYLEEVFDMEFVGGLVGVRQDPETLCLRPEVGWAVRPARVADRGPADDDFRFHSL